VHGETPEEVYGSISRLYETYANEADVRGRYVKLMLTYFGTLLYLSVDAERLLKRPRGSLRSITRLKPIQSPEHCIYPYASKTP
jgi:hypothetical protein